MQALPAPVSRGEQRHGDLGEIRQALLPEGIRGEAVFAHVRAPVMARRGQRRCIGRVWSGNPVIDDMAAPAALTQAVLHRQHVFVEPEVAEQGQYSSLARELAVKIRAPFPHANGGQMGRLQRRHLPLVHGEVGHAAQADASARPVLHSRPFDALVEVPRLARREQVHQAGRTPGAAHIHAHQHIALGHEALGVGELVVLETVAGQFEDLRFVL